MGFVYKRGSKWYVRYTEIDGELKSRPTSIRTDAPDGEAAARVVLKGIEAQVKAGVRPECSGPMTLAEWVKLWSPTRDRGANEAAQLERHAPTLMAMPMRDIKPAHLVEWVRAMPVGTEDYSPRSIWHRWNSLRVCLGDAVIKGHLLAIPLMPRGTLPAKVDANPEWRDGATYTIEEIEQLISDESIPLARRLLYALKGLTGMRHGEAVGLTWGRIDWAAKPLPKITVSRQYQGQRTKTLATKICPMHPALEAMVRAWRDELTERLGHAPGEADYVLPDVGTRKLHRQRSSKANPLLAADLAALGLRVRDGHDMRAAFVSALLVSSAKAGIPEHVTKSITHARAVVRDAFDSYKRVSYEQQCEAMLTLKVRPLHVVAQAVASGGGSYSGSYTDSKISKSQDNSSSFEKTVLPNKDPQPVAPGRTGKHLRMVTPDAAPLPTATEGQVSNAVTPARLDALEAAALALLEAVKNLRKP